jgi:DNA mismatch endonuclease (patch repair protein)
MRKTYNNYLGRNFNKRRTSDKISKAKRSRLMARIRSKNTHFETEFVSALSKAFNMRFKTNVSFVKGKPDILFADQKICVFLDSNFWHGWQYPRWKHLLKNNFWCQKIENNRKRDKKTTAYLKRHGWEVVRIWEHEIKQDINKQIRIIMRLIKSL